MFVYLVRVNLMKVKWKLQKRWAACNYHAPRERCSAAVTMMGWFGVDELRSGWGWQWVGGIVGCSGTAWQRGHETWAEGGRGSMKYGDSCCHLRKWQRRAALWKPNIPCDIFLAVEPGHLYPPTHLLPSISSPHSSHISKLALVINRWQQGPVKLWCEVHLAVDQYLVTHDSIVMYTFLFSNMCQACQSDTAVFHEWVCRRAHEWGYGSSVVY